MKSIAIFPLLIFAGCQNAGPAHTAHTYDTLATVARVGTPPGQRDTTTLGGMWYLQPMLPSDTAAGKVPTLDLNLEKSRFSGNTGCNNMHGEFWFSRTDSSLSFGDKMNITKKSCTGYNEPAFIKSLRSAGRYRLRDGVLTLLSDNNTELSHWVRKPGMGPKALKA
jgi:heat shock protein HslJ